MVPPSNVRSIAVGNLTTDEEQIEYIANLIECGQFYFRRTLEWLAKVWGLSGDVVRARFQLAVERCSADRQHEIAQRETSLASYEAQEESAMREFRRLRRSSPQAAKSYLSLAMKARTEYTNLAGLKTIKVEQTVNVWQRTEFVVAVDQFTEAALDVVAPADPTVLLAAVQAKLSGVVEPGVLAALPDVLDVVLGQLQTDAAARFGQILQGNGNSVPQLVEAAVGPVAAE